MSDDDKVKKTARIEDWSLLFHAMLPMAHLTGKVSGHCRIKDGTIIISSPMVDINYDENWVETHNTLYTLGEPDAEWLKWLDEEGIDHSHIRSKRSMN